MDEVNRIRKTKYASHEARVQKWLSELIEMDWERP